MKLKPYEKYKDSGVEWIGEIPENWNLLKAALIFDRVNKRSISGNEDLLSVSEYYGVKPRKNVIKKGDFLTNAESLIDYKKCEVNDLVMNIMLAWKKGLGITKYDGIVSPAYEVFRTNVDLADPIFFHYLLRTDLYALEFKKHSYGIIDSRLRLYPDNFKNILIINPPINEQKQIANFLDKKTLAIDKDIEKNKKLIELLKEKRTSLINHVVTKGLDPNARMKDSGVEWIGEIPENWEIKRMKFNAKINPSKKKTVQAIDTKINFLPMEKVFEDGTYDENSKTKYYKISKGFTYFEDNDVLLAKITPCFENGKGTLVNNLDYGFGFGTTEFHVIRNNVNVNSKFLHYFSRSHLFRVTGEAFMEGSAGQKRLPTDFVKDYYMPTPNYDEQKQIANFLDEKTLAIDKGIEKNKKLIELLEEYKKSLIHHVVTGKVNVLEV